MPRETITPEDIRQEDIRPVRLWLVDGTYIDLNNRYYAHKDGFILCPVIRSIYTVGVTNIYEVVRKLQKKLSPEEITEAIEASKHNSIQSVYLSLDISDIMSYSTFKDLCHARWTPEMPITHYYVIRPKNKHHPFTDVVNDEGSPKRYSMARMIYYSFNDVDIEQVHRAIVRKDTTAAFSLDNLEYGRKVNVEATMQKSRYGWMSQGNGDYDEANYTQVL